MKKRPTQLDIVLQELKRKKKRGVTSLYCFKNYGITRLSAIIFRLRHEYELNIDSSRVAVKNRFGDLVYFSCYRLK